jgi:hypothetical protein
VRQKALLYILLITFLAGCLALFLPDNDSPRIVKFLIVSQVLFAVSVGIYFVGRRFDLDSRHSRLLLIVLGFAITARVIMLVSAGDTFYLSDDIFRYIWDGKVNAHGINPFVYPPPSPELDSLQDDSIYPRINHPTMPTIYPPMAQNIFLVAYLMGGDGTLTFKLIAGLFELLTILALMVWLKKIGVERSHLLLYLFSPLVLIEFYLSSHLDILAMPFLVTSLIALHDRRPIVLGIMLALATMVKFYGLFFAFVILFHLGRRERRLFILSFAITIVLSYLPYVIGSDGKFLGNLSTYLQQWQFNGSVFYVLKYGLRIEWARIIVAAAFIGWSIYVAAGKRPIEDKLLRTYGGYLVLTPTFFPWYFVWMFPFAIRNLSWAFLILSSTVLLSYHVQIAYYERGTWDPIIWLGVAAYLPFYALLVWPLVKHRIVKRGMAKNA